MSRVIFFSKHRKNTIELVDENDPKNPKIVRFRPVGMIGQVTVDEETAKRMRKHRLFESTRAERGTFYESKPVGVTEKNNIIQGPKGAGHVAMDQTTSPPVQNDEEEVAKPPKKKKSTKKKNSKKK